MSENTQSFEKVLYSDVARAFDKIIQHKGSDIYLIGLYHLGGWDGIMPLFNTKSDLSTVQNHECSDNDKDCLIDYI